MKDSQLDAFPDDSAKPPASPAAARPGASAIADRIVRSAVEIADSDANPMTFQHTVLCQLALPYQALTTRTWERRNGYVELQIEAGSVRDPTKRKWIPVPLPYGARARLILMHLNREALRTQSRTVETDDSLTAFVRKLLGRPPRGRDIRSFKEQLTTLSAAQVRLAVDGDGHAVQVDTKVVTGMDLWAPTDPNQRVMWPSTIRLGDDYFESLMTHAVPLDERAVAALSHSAVALDLYAWLAQRLHRIRPGRKQFIAWPRLHEQFGGRYKRVRDFRSFFLRQLAAVQTQYPEARIGADRKGLTLRHSAPPIPPRAITGPGTTLETTEALRSHGRALDVTD